MRNSYAFLIPFLLSPAFIYAQQAGTLDTSFGTEGKVVTLIDDGSNFTSTYDCIYSIALQSDEKIIGVGGAGHNTFNLKRTVVRYHSDGQLDTDFGVGGSTSLGNPGSGNVFLATAVQDDDRIVAVGRYNSDFTISRFYPDGSLDPDFGSGGIVSFELDEGSNDNARAVAIQADGKIVVGGDTYYSNQVPWSANFFMVRLNADGSLDTTFGDGGQVITDFNGQADHIFALEIQPDGKILAAGDATYGGDSRFALARYNTDGSLDSSFGEEGKVSTNFTANSYNSNASARTLNLLDEGKILVGGATNQAGAILGMARYNSDGSLDTDFGDEGQVTTQAGPATGMAVQADGKIVAGGGTGNFLVARYNADGSADLGFGDQGQTVTDFATKHDQAFTLLLQPDGQIVLAGSTQDYDLHYGATMFGLARYHGGESTSVGIADTNKPEVTLTLYPNPVKDILHLEAAQHNIQKISLLSITGQVLASWEQQSYINMSQFAAGVYFVKITTDNGGVLVERVVVGY